MFEDGWQCLRTVLYGTKKAQKRRIIKDNIRISGRSRNIFYYNQYSKRLLTEGEQYERSKTEVVEGLYFCFVPMK